MITIEIVRKYVSWMDGGKGGSITDYPVEATFANVVELAISQHEEIERLRMEVFDVTYRKDAIVSAHNFMFDERKLAQGELSEAKAEVEKSTREVWRLYNERDEAYETHIQVLEALDVQKITLRQAINAVMKLKAGEPK